MILDVKQGLFIRDIIGEKHEGTGLIVRTEVHVHHGVQIGHVTQLHLDIGLFLTLRLGRRPVSDLVV